jgi:hypothetical protein
MQEWYDAGLRIKSHDPACERYLQEDESATHILCDCEAIAYLRFRHIGQFFMEPSDFYDASPFIFFHGGS